MVDFGNRLKNLRLQENYTQAQLAERLNLTKSVISAYENGLRLPSYDVMISISRIFHVSVDYLVGNETRGGLTVDLSGLTQDEINAVKALVRAMKR